MGSIWIINVLAIVAAVAAGLTVVGHRLRGRWGGGRWPVLLATAAAVVAGHRYLVGEWPLPTSREAAARVVVGGAAAAAVAVLLVFRNRLGGTTLAFAVVAPLSIVGWVLSAYPTPPGASRSDFTFDHWTLAVGGTLWLLAAAEPIAARTSSAAAAWACGCVAAGLGAIELFTTSTKPGMLTAAVGAAIGGTFLATVAGFGPRLDRGPVAVWAVLLVSILTAHQIGGGELDLLALGLLALVPAVAWVGEIGPIRRSRPWRRELLRGTLVAAPTVAAVMVAYAHHVREAADNGGY